MKDNKLLICSKKLGEGYSGWGKFAENLAGYLCNHGMEVVFWGKRFYKIENEEKKPLSIRQKLNSLWRTKTVFFPNFYDFNFFRILFFKLILNKKVIVRICANELRYRRIIKLKTMVGIMNLVDHVIVLNLEKKNFLEDHLKKKDKILYIPNPVSAFYLGSCKKQNNETRKNILFVGSICERKGALDLIRAYKNSGVMQTHQLELIGPMGYGESKPEYMDKVKNAIGDLLNEKIFLHDTLPKEALKRKYLSSKVLVLPSYSEGMPNTLLEAMSCGMICIGSDIPGINENLIHGQTGFLFQPGDTNSLSKLLEISTTLINDNSITLNAFHFIEKERNPDEIFEKYRKIFVLRKQKLVA